MKVTVISIDPIAAGFLRQRFVRALTASWAVLAACSFIAILLFAVLQPSADEEIGLAVEIIGGLVAVVLMGLAAIQALAWFGAWMERMPARGLAGIGLLFYGFLVVVLPLSAAGALMQVLEGGDSVYSALGLLVFSVVGAAAAYEAFQWARWQLTVSEEGLAATQGWRPSRKLRYAMFRKVLGLPAYISNFGEGRTALTVVYFFVAVLNAGLVSAFIVPALAVAIEDKSQQDVTGTIVLGVVLVLLLLLNIVGLGDGWPASRTAWPRGTTRRSAAGTRGHRSSFSGPSTRTTPSSPSRPSTRCCGCRPG